jgi:hypothetical protein
MLQKSGAEHYFLNSIFVFQPIETFHDNHGLRMYYKDVQDAGRQLSCCERGSQSDRRAFREKNRQGECQETKKLRPKALIEG